MDTLLSKIKKGISKTRSQVFKRVSRAISAKNKIDDELLDEIEEILIGGDVGVETAMEIIENTKICVKKNKYEKPQELITILSQEIQKMFPIEEEKTLEKIEKIKPFVILTVGVNGVGKTTFIAKLANKYQQLKKKILLVAGDTFRAGAIEQLEIWASRLNTEIIRHQSGSDPGAVVFDAITAAKSRSIDVVLIDTAGRLHTKTNLMEELKKIKRVIQKVDPSAPHETLLILDANIGQNAFNQATQFIDAIGITGLVLTKLDGTAKGGSAIGISHRLGIPLKYLSLGESLEDFEEFDPALFVTGLLEE
jgi:fused signal recognition particle receptor